MKKLMCLIVLMGVLKLSFGQPARVNAQSPWPDFCTKRSLPSHDPKYPDDQSIMVCIPPNTWNGVLVMYAHGYVPAQSPLALPTDELTLPDGTFLPEMVTDMGYAFATTSYHKNGYAVEQARKDLNNLLNYFKTLVPSGSLQQVLLIGASEGGEITAMMLERFPDKYDGGLALCGPIGGGLYQVQFLSDFRVLFDYFFPNVFSFGVLDIPEDAFLSWGGYPKAIADALIAEVGAGVQLFNVSNAAIDPGNPTTTIISTTVSILYYSIWGTNDLISTAGGVPYDNQSTAYSGSDDDLLLNAGIERIQSDAKAQAYLQRFYQTTGELKRPLVTMHNTLDPVVPFQHEQIYANLVAGAGSSNFLTGIPVVRYGHCNFTFQEILGAFTLLVQQASAQGVP